jgi:retron-type reverse transcriptase
VDILYLDFKKAFDSVSHQKLLQKAINLGISDQCVLWIKDFLTGRTQQVKMNSSLSETKEVTSGVPQGSVIGPTLFIMFINDLPDNIKSDILLFADDVKLYKIVNNQENCRELQEDLTRLYAWSMRWQLHFNPLKCELIRLGKHPPVFEYHLGSGTNWKRIAPTHMAKNLV